LPLVHFHRLGCPGSLELGDMSANVRFDSGQPIVDLLRFGTLLESEFGFPRAQLARRAFKLALAFSKLLCQRRHRRSRKFLPRARIQLAKFSRQQIGPVAIGDCLNNARIFAMPEYEMRKNLARGLPAIGQVLIDIREE